MPTSTNATLVEPDPVAPDSASPSRDKSEPRSATPPAAHLVGVAHRLGDRWALRGITLRVDTGETVAVVGPNGSGKTTLLRILATSLVPLRGSGEVFGHDLASDPDAVRRVVAMLGHSTGLYDELTAAENLAFAVRMQGDAPSAGMIDGVLDAVGMLTHGGDRVRTLSSGMRRRIALARLLLRRPRLLLLDEPYNALDAAGVELVDGLIRETASSGGAALVVTHDLGRLASQFDRVVTLGAGRVITDRRLEAQRS